MISIDPSHIASILIASIIGGWIFWVSRNIIKNGKDITACFEKIRGKQKTDNE